MIGGEFEIDLSRKGTFVPQPDTYYYASGRAALYQILISINDREKNVFLPDYLCHTLVEAVEKAGYNYKFYELNNLLEAEPKALFERGYNEGDIIVQINYFGLQDLGGTTATIKSSCKNCIIIEDDVQAYYQYSKCLTTLADYRYTSYRKTFAVPDGAPVFTKNRMHIVDEANTFAPYKIKAGDMKFHRDNLTSDEEYLTLFQKGAELIGENYDSRMSPESKALFAGCDVDVVGCKRKENAQFLLKGLTDSGIKTILPVSDDKVPLFIPIWLENRNEVRKRMFSSEIFCPVHWPLEGLKLKKGIEMAEHELSLIVDQRYGVKDMQMIIEGIKG